MTYLEVNEMMTVWIKKIRELKSERKNEPNGYVPGLYSVKREFRHWHIAMSELRGKKREQIENPRKDNLPDEKYIASIKAEIEQAQNAA